MTVETSTNVACTVACAVETEEVSTAGGLTKKGSGTLNVFGVNTYGGPTRLEEGTLAFIDPNGFPGGDVEIPAATLQALSASSAPLLTVTNFVQSAGKVVRITQADTLDDRTFGKKRTVARFATAIGTVPTLEMMNSDGTVRSNNGTW